MADTNFKHFPTTTTLNCGGRLLDLSGPVVMAILNVTPDSFYDGGRHIDRSLAVDRAMVQLMEGAQIIDVGGMSTRPGAETVSVTEELDRVIPVIEGIMMSAPETIISIDTVHAAVARAAVGAGASIINDVSAGRMDSEMYHTVAELDVPYVLMHMRGTPKTMQQLPTYNDVVLEVLDFFMQEVAKLRALGVKDIVLDPGFGFGKTAQHNFTLLQQMGAFRQLGCPVLAGISRKSMIYKTLGVTPEEALNGTTALHVVALQQGAQILRVHDVRPAMETIKLLEWIV